MDGLAAAPIGASPAVNAWAETHGRPLVLLRAPPPQAADAVMSVRADGAAAVAQAVRHLFQLGHRKLALVVAPAEKDPEPERLERFRALAHELDVTAWVVETELALDAAQKAVGRVLAGASSRRPTAFITNSDYLAQAIIGQETRTPMSEQTDAVLTTLDATIIPGEAVGRGSDQVCRRLAPAPGEPHITRDELTSGRRPETLASLLRFVHVTDYQLADLASPGRIDFVQRYADRPGWAGMVPAYRPQEFVSTHAFEAMARTVARLATDPGAPVRFVLTTGDNTDNAQLNELRGFLALMHGGDTVDPTFGVGESGDIAAIPSYAVSGDYYNPEPESRDRYKQKYGFPDLPGLLSAAAGPFPAQGFGVDWLVCFGNHDCLAQGRAPVTPGFQDLLAGGKRPVAAPAALPQAPAGAYLTDPRWYAEVIRRGGLD